MSREVTCFVVTRPGNAAPVELTERLARHARVITGSSAEDFRDIAADVDAIITWGGGNPKFLLEPLDSLPARLRWVAHAGIGVDQFLFPRLVQSDVVVTNMRGVSSYATAMAEFAFAGIMLFGKRLLTIEQNRQNRHWERVRHALLQDQTVGIIGFGTIGREIARIARGFGMTVLATRRESSQEPDPGITVYPAAELDRLLEASDYVVIAAPRTHETHGLIGSRELGLMRKGSVLINVARGGMVDEAALLDALHSGQLGGAALDVFEKEPLPADSPLWSAPNLFLSPHMSAFVETVPGPIVDAMIDNMQRFQQGQPLQRVVDKQRGY